METLPTWEWVYEVIRQIDGENLTNFALCPLNGEGASLLCGVGDWIDGEKRYVVKYFIEENGSGYHLINPDEPEDQEYELTILVPDVQPARYCVKQEDVIKAFAYFYQTSTKSEPSVGGILAPASPFGWVALWDLFRYDWSSPDNK